MDYVLNPCKWINFTILRNHKNRDYYYHHKKILSEIRWKRGTKNLKKNKNPLSHIRHYRSLSSVFSSPSPVFFFIWFFFFPILNNVSIEIQTRYMLKYSAEKRIYIPMEFGLPGVNFARRLQGLYVLLGQKWDGLFVLGEADESCHDKQCGTQWGASGNKEKKKFNYFYKRESKKLDISLIVLFQKKTIRVIENIQWIISRKIFYEIILY